MADLHEIVTPTGSEAGILMLAAEDDQVWAASSLTRNPGEPSLAQTFAWQNWPDEAFQRQALAPMIVLDATKGVRDVDLYHAQLVHFLGGSSPLVLVERMDEVDFEQEQFELIEEEYRHHLKKGGCEPLAVVPGPLNHRLDMTWFDFNETSNIDCDLESDSARDDDPLRISVTQVVRANDGWRLDGRLLSGTLSAGDKVLSSPSNQTAIVGAVVHQASDTDAENVSLIFHEPFFLDPGEVLSYGQDAPVETDVFRVRVLWSGGAVGVGDQLTCGTPYGAFDATIQSVDLVLDPVLQKISSIEDMGGDRFAEMVLRTPQIVALDSHEPGRTVGLIKISSDAGEGIGLISMEGYADQRRLLEQKSTNITSVKYDVSDRERAERNGHDGGVLWFTGLSGSGKSTLAMALEARLFAKGYQVFVLDGDNVRQGLTSNLGFSPDDRAENIRRVGEVAALFRQAGVIVISSFISPYRSDRDRARHAALSGFHEVYIKANVETCIARDPKGLYEKAIKGEIRDFTGISAPYEEPTDAELVIDTQGKNIESCVERLVNYVDRNFRL